MEIWIASVVVLWLVVIVMGFLLAGALRQLGLIALRLGDDPGALITVGGLNRGEHAPDFEAVDVELGTLVTLSHLPQRARVLVFITPSCLACRQLAPALNELVDTRGKEFEFLAICSGDLPSCRAFRRTNEIAIPVLNDPTGDIERAYGVPATPFIYVLDYTSRVLIRGVANNWIQLEALFDQEGTLEPTFTSVEGSVTTAG
jgi:methylamine dehydrogenase accessory protein MauD